jgi:hypothetical protein
MSIGVCFFCGYGIMEVTIMGQTVNVVTVAIAMIIGGIATTVLFCSCSKVSAKQATDVVKEGLANLDPSSLNYKMTTGVPQPPKTWGDYPAGSVQAWKDANAHTEGTSVPLSEGQLFMWAENKFSPTCCPGAVSSSTGCACISKEQETYITQRGGNNTLPSNY